MVLSNNLGVLTRWEFIQTKEGLYLFGRKAKKPACRQAGMPLPSLTPYQSHITLIINSLKQNNNRTQIVKYNTRIIFINGFDN